MTAQAPPQTPPPQPFRLLPFDPATAPAGVRLQGAVARSGAGLWIRYQLADPTGSLLLPPAAAAPARRDGLWGRTCLELFLALPGSAPYWEVNLSPSGDWNLYRLSGYRQGLAPEPAIAALPFAVERHRGGLALQLELPLAPLQLADQPLELAVTAVLERCGTAGPGADPGPGGDGGDGALSYWALAHPAAEADFHHRGGFRLRI